MILKEIWVKKFKNEPSKICGKQPLKNLKWYIVCFLKASSNFTWSILEYLGQFISTLNNIAKSHGDHSFSTYAKYSEKLIFLTLDTHTYVCVSRGKKCYFFGRFCVRTKWMISCYPDALQIPWLILLKIPRQLKTGFHLRYYESLALVIKKMINSSKIVFSTYQRRAYGIYMRPWRAISNIYASFCHQILSDLIILTSASFLCKNVLFK